MTNLLVFIILFLLPLSSLGFTKVVVPAVYKEWTKDKPHWVTDPAIQKMHNFTVFTYQKLDPKAPNYLAYNRGTETGVHLKYVVDHYHDFPDVAIFVHSKPHEHQTNWLNMVGCVNPNATWFNINYEGSYNAMWVDMNPDFWKEDGQAQEQCWRDVLQITWELKDRKEEFLRRVPPTSPLTISTRCCNQFLVSRAMIHKRPLHVWKDLLRVIAMKPLCHMGDPDYENLYAFNRTGRIKMPEKLHYLRFGESQNNPIGAVIPGMTGEFLNHVIFGHQELQMKPPTQVEICQNFIRGCPGSPCRGPPEAGYPHRTVVVQAQKVSHSIWCVVLHEGKRHDIPDTDTLEGLEIPPEDIVMMNVAHLRALPAGPPLTPCDKTWVPNTCKDSVYYKALHKPIQ